MASDATALQRLRFAALGLLAALDNQRCPACRTTEVDRDVLEAADWLRRALDAPAVPEWVQATIAEPTRDKVQRANRGPHDEGTMAWLP